MCVCVCACVCVYPGRDGWRIFEGVTPSLCRVANKMTMNIVYSWPILQKRERPFVDSVEVRGQVSSPKDPASDPRVPHKKHVLINPRNADYNDDDDDRLRYGNCNHIKFV